jgi:long-chain acyl-CoA synthetase
MTIGEYLTQSVREFPDKEALVCGTRRLTYREIGDLVHGTSNFFNAQGLQVGDRVAVCLDNSPEMVFSIFGILQAGGTMVLITPGTPTERMGYILRNCEPRFMIAPALRLGQIKEAAKDCPAPPITILVGEQETPEHGFRFEDACQAPEGAVRNSVSDEDVAAIIYTSGSTGKPKGVTLTHHNFDIVTDAVIEYLEHTPDDVILDFLPLSIGYGLLQLLVTYRAGGSLVLEKGFGYPYEIIKRLKEEHVTGFAGVPTVYSIITHLSLENESFPVLRYITNAAAAMPGVFLPRLRKIFPATKIYLMHGLTECLRTTYLPPHEVDTTPSSVGSGMKYVELWIEDPEGNRLPAGQVGEMVVRGPNIMKGYWNDPEGTAKAVRIGPDGRKILRTGDLFMMDERGYFHFVGRTDDIIKSRGRKVSPLEIEETIYRCEDVLEVRAIGIPDTLLGHAIKAEIVLKRGSPITIEYIKAHCQKHLEDFQIPHIIEFVPSLPKSAGGKIRRVA